MERRHLVIVSETKQVRWGLTPCGEWVFAKVRVFVFVQTRVSVELKSVTRANGDGGGSLLFTVLSPNLRKYPFEILEKVYDIFLDLKLLIFQKLF